MNIKNKDFKLLTGLQVKAYIPMTQKREIAQAIINESTQEINGAIQLDSVQQYMSYVKHMILSHTNLEYTDEDYDTLCSTTYQDDALLNVIMGMFANDAQECSRILKLMAADYLDNNSLNVSVGKFLAHLTTKIDTLADNLTSKIDEINISNILPADVDIQQVGAFLSAMK